ncbi:MAG: lysylphosphatidylglycerol synthase transmembrane domain-containing protein [Terriglobia bacterium]
MSAKIQRWLYHAAALALLAGVWYTLCRRGPLSAWHLTPVWLLGALLTTSAMLAVRVEKWRLLLAEGRIPCSRFEPARSLLGAYALASITPGRLGDLSRCMFTSPGGRTRVLAYTVTDKLFDVFSALSFAALSLFFLVPYAVAALGVVAWLGLIVLLVRGPKLLAWQQVLPRRLKRLRELAQAAGQVRCGRFAALAVCAGALDLCTLFFLLSAFHATSFTVALAVYPWLIIAGGLPVSLGGLGPREGLCALLFPLFSVSSRVAVGVSLVFFAFTAVLPAALGALWFVIEPPRIERGWRESLAKTFRQTQQAQHS